MQVYLNRILSFIPEFKESDMNEPFRDARIDSIDLVAIRVEFESILGKKIPDEEWLKFESVSEIINYCLLNKPVQRKLSNELTRESTHKSVVINMPQMALEALSENWLFKEIGGFHWDKICDGLNESSFNLKDDIGNRLYATFVRIRLVCNKNLKAFNENEILNFDGQIKRFGESMYFSNLKIESNEEKITAELMTTFSIRNATDNTKLAKSQPSGVKNQIEQFSSFPNFGNEYRLMKKGELESFSYKNFQFDITDSILFEIEYELNPYYDLNGVNLLYFAAYPIINDICEAKYFNVNLNLEGRWEQTYYTSYKDVFYFSNCNISETIIYQMNYCQKQADDSYIIQSTLFRKSDMVPMAKIFTIKSRA
jgi:probable biosynthetic protein (TIGR04098 family)